LAKTGCYRSVMSDQKHLYLVDGSAYIFRAYHALPPLTRKTDGLPVGDLARDLMDVGGGPEAA